MRKLLIALVMGVIAWQAWGAYQKRDGDEEFLDGSESSVTAQLVKAGRGPQLPLNGVTGMEPVQFPSHVS